MHWLIRRPLLEISFDPDGAGARRAVRAWDLVFYASFGVVVTSSVRLAGVLLVFAYLIVPATAAVALARSARGRLLVGWALGILVSVAGLVASWTWDLPTGATVVVTFGVLGRGRHSACGARRRVSDARARRGHGSAAMRLRKSRTRFYGTMWMWGLERCCAGASWRTACGCQAGRRGRGQR